jgi:hypothetical protein
MVERQKDWGRRKIGIGGANLDKNYVTPVPFLRKVQRFGQLRVCAGGGRTPQFLTDIGRASHRQMAYQQPYETVVRRHKTSSQSDFPRIAARASLKLSMV